MTGPAHEHRHAALDAKTVATLTAKCALVGLQLHVAVGDGGTPSFVVSRWGRSRQMRTVEEVEDLVRVMGGAE